MRRGHDWEATLSKSVIWGFESLTACKRLVINKKTSANNFNQTSVSIYHGYDNKQSSVNWEVGQ